MVSLWSPARGRRGHDCHDPGGGSIMKDTPIFNTRVTLIGADGNAFSILGACRRAANRAKIPQEKIDVFMTEAMAGDYDNLLQVVTKYFIVE